MEIIKINDKNALKKAVTCLQQGGILIYPTETCYGVGVDATNADAVKKVLSYKKRPAGKAISIGVTGIDMAQKYVEVNETAKHFYEEFLPGPITLVSKSKHKTDKRLESETGTLGIRVPDKHFLLEVIKKFKKPITTTSANSSGKKTPYNVQDILDNLTKNQKELISLIIDEGELPHNPPSTVIDTTTEELTIYRKGLFSPDTNATIYFSDDVEKTVDLGKQITEEFLPVLEESPLVFLLNGQLGTGKTQFAKGVGKALGIQKEIKSPTYSYVDEYKIPHIEDDNEIARRGTFYHADAWKVQSKDDLDALQFSSWFKPGNVILIEWPSVVMNLDEESFKGVKVIYVDILDKGDTKREIKVYK